MSSIERERCRARCARAVTTAPRCVCDSLLSCRELRPLRLRIGFARWVEPQNRPSVPYTQLTKPPSSSFPALSEKPWPAPRLFFLPGSFSHTTAGSVGQVAVFQHGAFPVLRPYDVPLLVIGERDGDAVLAEGSLGGNAVRLLSSPKVPSAAMLSVSGS